MIDRVSSNQVYRTGIGSILEAQSQLSRIQEQVASGKRIQNPSDDPTAAAEIVRLRSELNRVEAYQRTADRAISSLSFEESAVAGAESVLAARARARCSGRQRRLLTHLIARVIASEIDGLRESLLNIGNTRNADGEYIFAGDNVNTAAFSESGGGITYNGSGGPRLVNIASGIRIQMNDTGAELFQSAPAGNGAFEVVRYPTQSWERVLSEPRAMTIASQVPRTTPSRFQPVGRAASVHRHRKHIGCVSGSSGLHAG